MKKIGIFFLLIVLCAAMAFPVSALSGADTIRSESIVAKDGSCRVVVNMTFTLDTPVVEPVFPIPAAATDVVINGNAAGAFVGGKVPLKQITGGMAGTFSVSVSYNLPSVVSTQQIKENDKTRQIMVLTLPILSGFAYPVEKMEYSVTLPAAPVYKPVFSSGYHQEDIALYLSSEIRGAQIYGSANSSLKDHETLNMTLRVDETMFPQTATTARVLSVVDILIVVVALLAGVYYVLRLWPGPFRKRLRLTPPEGITAGDVPLWLTGSGVDLTMLVVTWAQLGYLRIQIEDSGRVLLHKQMEMGNERSSFENRCYRALFSRRRIVDGTGYHYAMLVRKMATQTPGKKEIFRSDSGNPYLFRGLCALSGLGGGITMANAFLSNAPWLAVFLSALTTAMSLLLQSGTRGVLLRRRLPLWLAIGSAVLWLLLGIWSGEWLTAVLLVAFQIAAGGASVFGGRRTEFGRLVLHQLLGLRRYMCKAGRKEVLRLLKANPDYFYELAPYALAMGVDRSFARRFTRIRLQDCTYLIGGSRGQTSAAEWMHLLRSAVNTMDAKAQRLPYEKFLRR